MKQPLPCLKIGIVISKILTPVEIEMACTHNETSEVEDIILRKRGKVKYFRDLTTDSPAGIISFEGGRIAQWGEHSAYIREVTGSSPVSPTNGAAGERRLLF